MRALTTTPPTRLQLGRAPEGAEGATAQWGWREVLGLQLGRAPEGAEGALSPFPLLSVRARFNWAAPRRARRGLTWGSA